MERTALRSAVEVFPSTRDRPGSKHLSIAVLETGRIVYEATGAEVGRGDGARVAERVPSPTARREAR